MLTRKDKREKRNLEKMIIGSILNSQESMNLAILYKIEPEYFSNKLLNLIYKICFSFSKKGHAFDKFSILYHAYDQNIKKVILKIDKKSLCLKELSCCLRQLTHFRKLELLEKWRKQDQHLVGKGHFLV